MYVVSAIGIGYSGADVPNLFNGFNLDGLISDGSSRGTCSDQFQDLTSSDGDSLGTTGNRVGIDNAFGSLLPWLNTFVFGGECGHGTWCYNLALNESLSNGRGLMLIEISDVSGFEFDDDVGVAIYAARALGGAPALASDGRIAAGQTFETIGVVATPVRGDLFNGVVRATWPSVELVLPRLPGVGGPSSLSQVELRVVIEPGRMWGGFGGSEPIEAIQRDLAMDESLVAPFRAQLNLVADIAPNPFAPSTCDEVSFAFEISGIPASRSP